jgi:hypothetical protein
MRAKVYYLLFVLLFCQGVSCTKENCEEDPIDGCFSTKEYQPVCGCNNKTYGNAGEAKCAGIPTYTEGPCTK